MTRDIDHVRMHELSMQPEGRCIPFRDFFSEQFFYGDYNVTNPLFIRDFSPIIPKVSSPDMTIKKCLCFSQSRLQNDLDSFTSIDTDVGNNTTNVFPYKALKDFIISQADRFLRLIDNKKASTR